MSLVEIFISFESEKSKMHLSGGRIWSLLIMSPPVAVVVEAYRPSLVSPSTPTVGSVTCISNGR